jgi:uncharacterized protein (TIGR02246 family)
MSDEMVKSSTSADEQIRALVARYAQVHDNTDVDGLLTTFAHNGCLTGTAGVTATGRSAIKEMMSRIYARRQAEGSSMKHLYANSVINVGEDSANATTDIVVYQRTGDSPWHILLVGEVIDKLVREDGQWLFAERRVIDARKRES